MLPAKRVSRSKNRALTAAGTRLALLSVIVAGPVTLSVAVLSRLAALAAPPSAKPAVMRTAPARATDPSGYAQLFVRAWLRSSADDARSAQARLARSMAPNGDLSQPATDAQSTPEAVMTPRRAQTGGGSWSVTVPAQDADGWVHYYTVPVAADRTGTSFTVTGAPGVVAGPARAAETTSPYTVSVPDGDLSSAVGEFLAAYLTGAAEVDSSHPACTSPPSPPPPTRRSPCRRSPPSRRPRPPAGFRPTAPGSAST
ncbi:conjugal transfer protein [Streptomyces sp. NPDC048419]|uniref:conjugal transfer protein n=1 Tax=Streptomyces sp. NPDC048419 TaxID=3365547 RepID=UPI00371B5E06